MTAVLVQQMVPSGVEMIVRALQDPMFGPVIACGTGGILVDLLADTAFRLHPLNASDAAEMVDELRGARLLRGYLYAHAEEFEGLTREDADDIFLEAMEAAGFRASGRRTIYWAVRAGGWKPWRAYRKASATTLAA